MILTKRALLSAIELGHIVCPSIDLVDENSIRFALGEDMWTCAAGPGEIVDLSEPREFERVHGTWDGYFTIEPDRVYIGTTAGEHGTRLLGDGIAYVPEMRARSTTGRHGLTVALCAGMGDVGYCGRWAVEIVNNNHVPVRIRAGAHIGQFVYHTASTSYPDDAYIGDDRYQTTEGIRFLPKVLV